MFELISDDEIYYGRFESRYDRLFSWNSATGSVNAMAGSATEVADSEYCHLYYSDSGTCPRILASHNFRSLTALISNANYQA